MQTDNLHLKECVRFLSTLTFQLGQKVKCTIQTFLFLFFNWQKCNKAWTAELRPQRECGSKRSLSLVGQKYGIPTKGVEHLNHYRELEYVWINTVIFKIELRDIGDY